MAFSRSSLHLRGARVEGLELLTSNMEKDPLLFPEEPQPRNLALSDLVTLSRVSITNFFPVGFPHSSLTATFDLIGSPRGLTSA